MSLVSLVSEVSGFALSLLARAHSAIEKEIREGIYRKRKSTDFTDYTDYTDYTYRRPCPATSWRAALIASAGERLALA